MEGSQQALAHSFPHSFSRILLYSFITPAPKRSFNNICQAVSHSGMTANGTDDKLENPHPGCTDPTGGGLPAPPAQPAPPSHLVISQPLPGADPAPSHFAGTPFSAQLASPYSSLVYFQLFSWGSSLSHQAKPGFCFSSPGTLLIPRFQVVSRGSAFIICLLH